MIYISGCGAVSPAGWGMDAFRRAIANRASIPATSIEHPRAVQPTVRRVPPLNPKPPALTHARLRRSSPISQFAISAALEALGPAPLQSHRLGIVLCVMAGCVNYSRRFYAETIQDPATASPLVFPETVFNAPASHVATLLGTSSLNYTLIGDPGTFLIGLALAAQWLSDNLVDQCLVIGAEETDWLTADAFQLFTPHGTISEGAAALCLQRNPAPGLAIELDSITDPHLFTNGQTRSQAALNVRAQLPSCSPVHLLCDSTLGHPKTDQPENCAWADWTAPRLSLKSILGEGLAAASAWQCAAAFDALARKEFAAASVSVVGCNQQAIGAHFIRHESTL